MYTFLKSSHQAGSNHMKKPYCVFYTLNPGFAPEWLKWGFMEGAAKLEPGCDPDPAARRWLSWQKVYKNTLCYECLQPGEEKQILRLLSGVRGYCIIVCSSSACERFLQFAHRWRPLREGTPIPRSLPR